MSLVGMAVHPDALLETAVDPREQLLNHRRFLDRWMKFGRLFEEIVPTEGACLLDAIQKLPVALRKDWSLALQERPPVASEALWSCVVPGGKAAGEVPQVACLPEAMVIQLGLTPDKWSVCPPGCSTEVTLLRYLDQAETLRQAEVLACEDIRKGTLRTEVWERRIAPLAMGERFLSVVDRYALKNLVEQGERSGAFFFLHTLSGQAPDKTRVVWFAEKPSDAGRAWLEHLSTVLKESWVGPQTVIEVVLLRGITAKEEIHDRYLRFGGHHVLRIGKGLDVFRLRHVPETTDCVLTWDAQRRRQKEFTLQRLQGTETHRVPVGST